MLSRREIFLDCKAIDSLRLNIDNRRAAVRQRRFKSSQNIDSESHVAEIIGIVSLSIDGLNQDNITVSKIACRLEI
jgi:hypothetical protein